MGAAYATAQGQLLRAGVALAAGREGEGAAHLEQASRDFEASGMGLYQHAVDIRRGRLLGDADLSARAAERIRRLGWRDAPALAALTCPY
jgi:hypothetical protein